MVVSFVSGEIQLSLGGFDQTKLSDGWHHILVQVRQGHLEFYLNGKRRSSAEAPILLHTSNLTLDISDWLGELDDVRLYSFAFPFEQVPNLVYRVVSDQVVESCRSNGRSF